MWTELLAAILYSACDSNRHAAACFRSIPEAALCCAPLKIRAYFIMKEAGQSSTEQIELYRKSDRNQFTLVFCPVWRLIRSKSKHHHAKNV